MNRATCADLIECKIHKKSGGSPGAPPPPPPWCHGGSDRRFRRTLTPPPKHETRDGLVQQSPIEQSRNGPVVGARDRIPPPRRFALDGLFGARRRAPIGAAAADLFLASYTKQAPPGKAQFFRHYKRIAAAVDMPIVGYNIPGGSNGPSNICREKRFRGVCEIRKT